MHVHFNKMLSKAPVFGEGWLTSWIPHCRGHIRKTHTFS